MELVAQLHHPLTVIAQIVIIDLLLGGDNAMVIALACRNLPRHLRNRARIAGTAAAVVLRALLTVVAGLLMHLPMVGLIGAMLLLVIAVRLLRAEQGHPEELAPGSGVWGAVTTIVVADLAMSVDNVVAVAAAAHGSIPYMVLGLLLSVPLVMFGSVWVGRLIEAWPLLVPAGAALLGWIAGQLALSDPLVLGHVAHPAPALRLGVPALGAALVLLAGGAVRRRRRAPARHPHP